jgi:Pyruvate/2-oxoacid:ferredoxin oxidoreductase gamma subunit
VTVISGHSVSEVILAKKEIGYTGITKPDVMFVLFKEGLNSVHSQIAAMNDGDTLFVNRELLPIHCNARLVPIDFKQTGRWANKKEYWAIIAIATALAELNIYPLEAFKEAVSMRSEFAEENLAAIEAGEKYNLEE